jgi:hypothetical protein
LNRSALAVTVVFLFGACTLDAESEGEVAAGAGSGPAMESPLLLLGKVIDGGGAPVPRATVSVGDSFTTTAPDGWFDLQVPAAGRVAVGKPGWVGTEIDWEGSSDVVRLAIEPIRIRGLRVGGGAAGDDADFAEILALARDTAVNALVFDTKQEGGRVLYDTSVAAAHEWGAVVKAYDPAERIAQARERDLYLITRIVTFEDWFWAEARPELAFEGPWINPTITSAWEYPLALAEEACKLGFDEIQFDYVRFPSESTAKTSGQLEMTQEERVGAVEAFLEEARQRLHSQGCAVSADVFGIVVSARNDQGIGQRPEELTRHLDAFSPMIYPSHYSDGWLGFEDPNEHPYDVTSDAIEDGLARIEPGVVLRPWLQAFWWTDEQIRRSIQAAEDHEVGWILWNAVSNFSRAAIPTDAELGPASGLSSAPSSAPAP